MILIIKFIFIKKLFNKTEFDKKQINAMIEWFGNDMVLKEKDKDTYIAQIFVNKKAIKYFAMQYSQFVKIVSPKSLVEEMRE